MVKFFFIYDQETVVRLSKQLDVDWIGSASWAEVATEQLLGKTYCFRLDKDLSIITCAFTKGLYEIRVEAESNKELALKKRKPLIPRLPFPSSYTLTLI